MVSRMLQQGQVYFCSNCHMRVFDLNKPNCVFCGSQFSNWADIQIEEFKKRDAEDFAKNILIHDKHEYF